MAGSGKSLEPAKTIGSDPAACRIAGTYRAELYRLFKELMEATTRIELVYTVLQTVA
jgi:hypothetical protein